MKTQAGQFQVMIKKADINDLRIIKSFDPFTGDREEDVNEERVFVFVKGGVARGFISMARAGLLGRPYVQYLAVNAEFRRLGIASTLLGYIERINNENKIFISTESSNIAMQKLLLNRGYTLAGEISGANVSGNDELYYFKENVSD